MFFITETDGSEEVSPFENTLETPIITKFKRKLLTVLRNLKKFTTPFQRNKSNERVHYGIVLTSQKIH